MDRQRISMLLAMFLTFAVGLLVYEALFSYSFKRRPYFVYRVIGSVLGVGAIATGLAFGLYGLFSGGLDPNVVWKMDLARAGLYILFVAMGIGVLFFCFDEKPALILFAAVAANAAMTVSSTLYGIWLDAFGMTSIYFTMYSGADAWSYVAFYLTHAVVLVLAWLLFARPFARAHKDFGKHINKFVLGIYVMYAFFTAGVSASQFFNMSLMGIDSIAIPVIFNGFSAFFAVFVLFVQRFNLLWVKDVQQQEAAQNFHQHYKDKIDKQQANMELVNQKLVDVKEQIKSIASQYKLEKDILDALNAVSTDIFDSGIQTGNEALDVLFTQKALQLNAKGIKTTLMIEGKALEFMDIEDVNVFFGNALDNAMDYLETVDEEKRFIRISSTRHRSLLMVRIENYCEKDVTFTKDGRPHSTMGGSQGYGTYSIRAVAEKYGGMATFSREGDLFVVTALFSACEPF